MSAILQEQNEIPHTLSVTVPVTSEMTQGIKPIGAVAEAQAWDVDSADMAQLAAEQRTAWAKRIDQVKAIQDDFMKPAKVFMTSIKTNCAKWFAPAVADLEAGRDILGTKLLAWDQAEKTRIETERRRIEDESRKIRQEAEAKAAAERARAEEQAREQRKREQEAIEAQRKAIAEGNAKAAAAAAAAAARANEAAQAAIENGEAKAQATALEAAAKASSQVAPVEVKISGQSVKTKWVAELGPGWNEYRALIAICQAIALDRTDLVPLLKIDTSATGPLNKLASALKNSMRVPGYVAKEVTSLAGSRK